MDSNLLNNRKNFNAVDVAKFILAFCVISIHTCYDFFDNAIINAIYDSVIIRIAVPFFFVASGFFFFRGIVFENGRIKKCPENTKKLFGFLKRTFFLYLTWAVIYFIWEAFTYIKAGLSLTALCKNYLLSFFLEGYSGQFWYLLFMMYAVIVLYILMRFLRTELVGVIVAFLFAVFLYGYTYTKVFDLDFLNGFLGYVMNISIKPLGIRFGVYLLYNAMGFIFGGLLCVKLVERLTLKASGVLALISLLLLTAENILIDVFLYDTSRSYTVFLLPTAMLGFIYLSKINLKGNARLFSFLRNSSSFIYCFHALPRMILLYFTDRKFPRTFIFFVVISAISLIMAFIVVPLSRKLKFLKKLY